MNLDEYQRATITTAVYSPTIGVEYCVIALCGEAGELANKYKKVLRGDKTLDEQRIPIIEELGDVLWYVAQLADCLNVDLSMVADRNLQKLERRKKHDSLKGEGDNR